jgi:hypothetical protein
MFRIGHGVGIFYADDGTRPCVHLGGNGLQAGEQRKFDVLQVGVRNVRIGNVLDIQRDGMHVPVIEA